MIKKITTNNAPAPIGPYSQGIIFNGLIFLSGSIPVTKDNEMIDGGIKEQTEQVIKNIANLLEASGSDFSKVIKTTCFLTSLGDFKEFNEVYAKYFTNNPARSCVEVSALPKGVKVEVEVIAYI